MRFYTRTKKPKLYGVLLLGTAAVAASAAAYRFAPGFFTQVSLFAFTAFAALSSVIMLVSFRLQIAYNPYSYNTIFYFGLGIFMIYLTLTGGMMTYSYFSATPDARDELNFLGTMQGSAKSFIVLSLPFLLVYAAGMTVSNLMLIRREGLRPVNLLGVLISVAFIGGWVLLFRIDYYFTGSETEAMIFDIVTNVLSVAFLYLECMLIGVIAANVVVTRHTPEPDKDYIIILGCGIDKNGEPRPLLRGRIERAVKLREDQLAATGKAAKFVVSGGKGADEVVSEAQSMKNYLIAHGVPEDQIILEDRSFDTLENMRFSKEKIASFGDASAKVAFSTTNYHVFRAGLCANRCKMNAEGVGSKTRWYFWPNASVREFLGLLTAHRGKQIFILAGLIAAFVAISIASYKI